MLGLYNLSHQPCSFDFVQWLVTATTRGVDEVRLHLNAAGRFLPKYYDGQQPERLKSIIEPACALAAVPFTHGKREGAQFDHMIGQVMAAYHAQGRIHKLRGVLPVEKGRYITITLRNQKKVFRNSNMDAWRHLRNVARHEVIWIPDYSEQPLHLHERMRLYEGALMNFFVSNGPFALCLFSEAPYCVFKMISGSGSSSEKVLRANGMPPEFQFPWRNERQRLVWEDDTPESVERIYGEMRAGGSW